MSNSQDAQNTEVFNLLQSLVNKVDSLTSNLNSVTSNLNNLNNKVDHLATNVNDLNNKVDNLTGEVQILSAEVQEVKADVRELKSWARATDIRLDNMDNKLVSFATEFTYLRDEVDSLNLRLNSIEAEIAAIKERQAKSEEINEAFRQEVLQRFKELEKDLAAFRRHIQSQENLEKEFRAFRQEVLSRLDELSDEKHYVDFLTLKSARMQMEINELKAEVAALQQR